MNMIAKSLNLIREVFLILFVLFLLCANFTNAYSKIILKIHAEAKV